MKKDSLLSLIHSLEVRAAIYCERDWEIYLGLQLQIKEANEKLVEIISEENETFLNQLNAG